MHYHDCSYGTKNGGKYLQLVPKDAEVSPDNLGQRDSLTDTDAAEINRVYECPTNVVVTTTILPTTTAIQTTLAPSTASTPIPTIMSIVSGTPAWTDGNYTSSSYN